MLRPPPPGDSQIRGRGRWLAVVCVLGIVGGSCRRSDNNARLPPDAAHHPDAMRANEPAAPRDAGVCWNQTRCLAANRSVISEYNRVRACQKSSDCRLLPASLLLLGCYTYVRAGADTSQLRKLLAAYPVACRGGHLDCLGRGPRPVCVIGLCTGKGMSPADPADPAERLLAPHPGQYCSDGRSECTSEQDCD